MLSQVTLTVSETRRETRRSVGVQSFGQEGVALLFVGYSTNP